jgi:hypothetical protein
MSIGYEALVRIEAAPSWGSQGTLGHRGIYLFADSVNPVFGAQPRERDNKLTGARESSGSTYSVDDFYPSCEITWQPRVDDILPVLLAHFQIGTAFAGGTYEFVRVDKNLTFTTNGSNWGTHPYSINVDVFYGNSLVGGGTGANGYRFFNGIVDKLTFNNAYGEDLKVTANIKFLTGSRFNFPSGFNGAPLGIGSFSEYSQLVDWVGTVAPAGEAANINVDNAELSFNNAVAERSKLGQRGWNRFPLAQHWMAEGNLGMEFNRDLNIIAEGTSNSGTFEWVQAAGNALRITYHNFVYRPTDPNVTDGQSVVDISLPFRAYPSKTGGTSCVFRVYTGTLFGTNLFNFFLLQ